MSWFTDLFSRLFGKKEIIAAPATDVEKVKPVLQVVPQASDLICRVDGRSVYKSNEVVYWSSGMQIDADGCPRAYHPKNIGLDWLANAGEPGNWYGLVTDDGLK